MSLLEQINKQINKQKNKKVGLALGSGGIKGLAHVGVIKALVDNEIPIDFIAGTSIGSWVGAHFALYRDIDLLEKFTIGKKKEKLSSLFEPSIKGGLIKGDKIEQLLNRWLADADFSILKIPLKIIATELITGKEFIFSEGKLSTAVRASISVPTIFTPFKHNERIYIDGGLCNPVPVNIVKEMGADFIIAVNLDNYLRKEFSAENALKSFTKITGRSIDIIRHYLSAQSVKEADIIIEPDNSDSDLSKWKNYFKNDIGKIHVEIGYKATEEIIPQIRRALDLNKD